MPPSAFSDFFSYFFLSLFIFDEKKTFSQVLFLFLKATFSTHAQKIAPLLLRQNTSPLITRSQRKRLFHERMRLEGTPSLSLTSGSPITNICLRPLTQRRNDYGRSITPTKHIVPPRNFNPSPTAQIDPRLAMGSSKGGVLAFGTSGRRIEPMVLGA